MPPLLKAPLLGALPLSPPVSSRAAAPPPLSVSSAHWCPHPLSLLLPYSRLPPPPPDHSFQPESAAPAPPPYHSSQPETQSPSHVPASNPRRPPPSVPPSLSPSLLKGAMTNEVFRIAWPSGGGEGDQRKVLVRINGQGIEVFFDRADEVRTFECMSRHGQGPRLLGRFHNGRVEEFINARTHSAADLRDPEISALIARKLREFHDLDMPGPNDVSLWQRLRWWLQEARSRCSPEKAREFRLEKMGGEVAMLENVLSGVDQRVGFSHNDLQYGNIMIYEVTKQVTLIICGT